MPPLSMPKDTMMEPVPALRPHASANLAFTGSSAQSSVLNQPVVRLFATQDCRIAVGADPTATSTSMYLPAGQIEYIAVRSGVDKIAAIQVSTGGSLNITEMT
jgi:hypothetical protein